MTLVVVTGTPGTGKSRLSQKLSLFLGYTYFNMAAYLKKPAVALKVSAGYDATRRSTIVDERKLTSMVLNELKNSNAVIDSHLAHYLPKEKVSLCIVTHTSLRALKRRLEARGYTKEKVRENLDAEIFDVCGQEARALGHQVLEFDTTGATNARQAHFFSQVKRAMRSRKQPPNRS